MISLDGSGRAAFLFHAQSGVNYSWRMCHLKCTVYRTHVHTHMCTSAGTCKEPCHVLMNVCSYVCAPPFPYHSDNIPTPSVYSLRC